MARNKLSPLISGLAPEELNHDNSPQERKSARMREAILEATLDCLALHGYANTTNNLICELARVSRGALLHHYPTRQDLMIAVTEYAFYKHMTAFSQAIRSLSEEERVNLNSGIVVDWEICQSREFQAYLELRVASRTNRELRSIFVPRARHHDQIWKEELLDVFPEWRADLRHLDLVRRFLRALLEGLVMGRELWKDPDTEWMVLGFAADLVQRLRVGELQFPSAESLEAFKAAGLKVMPPSRKKRGS